MSSLLSALPWGSLPFLGLRVLSGKRPITERHRWQSQPRTPGCLKQRGRRGGGCSGCDPPPEELGAAPRLKGALSECRGSSWAPHRPEVVPVARGEAPPSASLQVFLGAAQRCQPPPPRSPSPCASLVFLSSQAAPNCGQFVGPGSEQASSGTGECPVLPELVSPSLGSAWEPACTSSGRLERGGGGGSGKAFGHVCRCRGGAGDAQPALLLRTPPWHTDFSSFAPSSTSSWVLSTISWDS